MKNFTHFRLLFFSLILLFFSLSDAKAQLIESAECSYEDRQGCLFVAYETVQEQSATTLVVVINAILGEGRSCNNIDGLVFLPVGGLPIRLSRAELAADPFVEITVNRALFTATPDVLISSYIVPFPNFPFLFIPTEVVDLQARLDSDEPCLEITPLPVELITFEGAATGNGVELTWSTASEQNNSHFEVERSADGEAFEQVGNMAGHGNSSTRINYNHTDFSPLPGQSYYRLKQVDFDGQFEYSKIIAVMTTGNTDALQVTLAPNPCPNSDCQISIQNASGAQETRIELTDLSGRVLYTTTVQHGGKRAVMLPLQELPAHKGLYILSAISGGNVVRQRVVLE